MCVSRLKFHGAGYGWSVSTVAQPHDRVIHLGKQPGCLVHSWKAHPRTRSRGGSSVVVILCERLAVQHSDGRIICSMGRKLGVHLTSPARGCVSFRLESYVSPLIPPFDSHQLINDSPPSIIIPPLVDKCVHIRRVVIHALAPRGGVRAGMEPTVPSVHGSDLVFLCVKCVLGGRSVGPTCPWVPSLRTHTVLRE